MPSNMGIWIVIRVIVILLINYLSSYILRSSTRSNLKEKINFEETLSGNAAYNGNLLLNGKSRGTTKLLEFERYFS